MADNIFRETQIAQAGNNPSIVSPLSGAPTTSSTTITPPPSQNASDIHGYPEAMKTAQELSGKLYGSGFVSSGENAKDSMLKQLFSYDQQLEQGYSPYPQVPGYVENPADLYSAGASYAGGLGQVMGAVEGGIGNTEKAYQTAVGGVLDKLVDLLTIQENRKAKEEERKQKEEENLYNKQKDEREFLMTLARLSGGSFTDPITGKKITVPGSGSEGGGVRALGALIPGTMKEIQGPVRQGQAPLGVKEEPFSGVPTKEAILTALTSGSATKDERNFLLDLLKQLPEDGTTDGDVDNSTKLRTEYLSQSKDYIQTRDAYNRVSVADDSAAGDVSLIFGYMKMLDPGSVVREGEFATAENTRGVSDTIRQQYNKALQGDRLSPDQRKAFKNQASSIYKSSTTQHQTLIDEYSRLAKEIGLDPSMVIVDVGQSGGLTPTQDQDKIRVKRKSDGTTGTIPSGEFDERIYERL